MLNNIIKMYITLMPTIIAGILNMFWCKLKIFKVLKKPIDCNVDFFDGKRLFGDNKTWKGFIGYIILNIFMAIFWGIICKIFNFEKMNFFYLNNDNNVLLNIYIGSLLGLAYSVFELPNSFIKRRIGILPGKTNSGLTKFFFVILDQADSIIGCVLVVNIFHKLNINLLFSYILLGTFTHIIINVLLYCIKLRKNPL